MCWKMKRSLSRSLPVTHLPKINIKYDKFISNEFATFRITCNILFYFILFISLSLSPPSPCLSTSVFSSVFFLVVFGFLSALDFLARKEWIKNINRIEFNSCRQTYEWMTEWRMEKETNFFFVGFFYSRNYDSKLFIVTAVYCAEIQLYNAVPLNIEWLDYFIHTDTII